MLVNNSGKERLLSSRYRVERIVRTYEMPCLCGIIIRNECRKLPGNQLSITVYPS